MTYRIAGPVAWILLTAASVPLVAGCAGPGGEGPTADGADDTRFEERYVFTPDSVRLYVRVAGSGPDTVLVPLGAWLARELAPLAAGRTLVFWDPRSRGASDWVADTSRLGLERDLRDVEVVRAAVGAERVSLIGWSYLGAVVALYAAEHPERVVRVVQVGPMPPWPELADTPDERGSPPDSAELAYLDELERTGVAESNPPRWCRAVLLSRLVRPMMGRPEAAVRMRSDPCAHWNEWPRQLGRTVPHVLPSDWDYRERARSVRAPVLTIHGTDDPNAPVEGGRAWAELIPDARLVEVEGVGHAPWLEAPDTFFAEVDAFLP